jgi:hypothetical protein
VPSGWPNSRTSSNTLLPDRLTKIDETNRHQYYFLGADDRCYFFADFFSGKGWRGGATNQLVKNFKRPPEEIRTSVKAQQLLFYKDKAINEIAAALLKALGPAGVAQRTFVPIPPSKTPDHPDYCDRLEKTLRRSFATCNADIRLLLRQTASTEPDHRSGEGRMSYEDLLAITELDKAQLSPPLRAELVLFDDVLTSGKHYKVARTRIRELFPDVPLLGLFVARSIHPQPLDDPDAT